MGVKRRAPSAFLGRNLQACLLRLGLRLQRQRVRDVILVDVAYTMLALVAVRIAVEIFVEVALVIVAKEILAFVDRSVSIFPVIEWNKVAKRLVVVALVTTAVAPEIAVTLKFVVVALVAKILAKFASPEETRLAE